MNQESMFQKQLRMRNEKIEDLRQKLFQEKQDKQAAIGVANELGAHFDRLATGMGLQMTAEDLVDYILDNKERLL